MLQTKQKYYSLLEITKPRPIYMKRFLVIILFGLFANYTMASSVAGTSEMASPNAETPRSRTSSHRTSSPGATLEIIKETPLYRLERGIQQERTPLDSFLKSMRKIKCGQHRQLTYNGVVYEITKTREENNSQEKTSLFSWEIKKHKVINTVETDNTSYKQNLLLLFNALMTAFVSEHSTVEIIITPETNINPDEHLNPANERSLSSVPCTPRSSTLPPVAYTPRSEHNTSRQSIASVLAVKPAHPDAE